MGKIKKHIIDIYIILNIVFVFVSSYLRLIEKIGYKNYGKYIHIACIINIVVLLILTILKKKSKKLEVKVLDLLLLLMFLFGLISVVYAYDVKIAINGIGPRYEGIYAIGYYLSLAYLSSYSKNKKLIINVILVTGLVQTLYAICQVYNLFHVVRYINYKTVWATGFNFNPNFYATYVLLCLLYSIGLYYENNSLFRKLVFIFFVCVFMVGLLIANATSCAVGFIISYICILIYSLKKKEYKKLFCITIVIIITTFIVFKLGKTTLIRDLNRTGYEIAEVSKGNFDDQFGTKRMALWKKTMKIVPNYLLHGVGLDNFSKVLNGKPIIVGRLVYDKAHNEFLQILVTEGIFCLISYLLFYLMIVIGGIKKGFKNNNIYLVIPIIGYLVQAFFNISVIDVAPIFWIGVGFLICRGD